MKTFVKLIGIAALLLVSFTACNNPLWPDGGRAPGSGSGNTPSGSGDPGGGDIASAWALTVSKHQTWWQAGGTTYEECEDDFTIIGPSYATGSVVKGKLSFTLSGAPAVLQDLAVSLSDSLLNVTEILTYSDDNPAYTITAPAGTRGGGVVFEYLRTDDDTWVEIRKRRTGDVEGVVMYVYVSEDVTVAGKGGRGDPFDDGGPTYTVVLSDFSLKLKAGWNAVKMIETTVETSGGNYDLEETVSSGDHPGLIWALRYNK